MNETIDPLQYAASAEIQSTNKPQFTLIMRPYPSSSEVSGKTVPGTRIALYLKAPDEDMREFLGKTSETRPLEEMKVADGSVFITTTTSVFEDATRERDLPIYVDRFAERGLDFPLQALQKGVRTIPTPAAPAHDVHLQSAPVKMQREGRVGGD